MKPGRGIGGPAVRLARKAADGYRFVKLYGQHLPLAFEAVFSLRCTVILLEGVMRNGQDLATVLYAGRSKNYEYLRRMLFDECRVVDQQSTNLLALRERVEALESSADLVLVDLGWPYSGPFNKNGRYLEIPDWVNMAVELPDTWEEVVRTFRHTTRNNDLRLIRRNGYSYRTTTETGALQDFYDKYYLPFVRHQHGADSVLAPRRHVLKRGRQGALLQILRGEEVVAAGVVYPEGGAMYFLWMGLPPGHLERPPEAAISALYFFGIRYAFERGYRYVDFMGNRGFLNDGAFRFKRKWGAGIEDTFSPGAILMKPAAGSRSAALLCQRLPVLVRREEGLEALFLFADEGAVNGETLGRLQKEHGCAGIERVTAIQISDGNETESVPSQSQPCQYRLLRCSLDRFADCYVNH